MNIILKDSNIKFNENKNSEIIKDKSNEKIKDNKELEKEQIIISSLKNMKLYNEVIEKEIEAPEKSLKNIKSVFYDIKGGKDKSDNQRYTFSFVNTNSNSKKMNYELNSFERDKEIHENDVASLIAKDICKPNSQKRNFNSIIIFDWDDTLLPTSFLSPGGIFNLELKLTKSDREKLSKIEKEVYNLLNNAINKGDVYIITNAEQGWVELSINLIYPSLLTILPKIKIISAREKYEHIFPGNYKKWKIKTFLYLLKNINLNLITNLICIGDSFFEIEAGRILASKFKEAFIKTIKFKETPKLNDLLKELSVVNKKFNFIYSTIRNMKIKVEKKMN